MTGFSDPILTGDGSLIRVVERSDNYVAGVSGWAIFANGDCEFNSGTFRGTVTAGTFQGTRFVINSAGAFFYSGTPANGNLILSIAPVGGTDSFGNTYSQGMTGYTNQGTFTVAASLATQGTKFIQIQADTGSQLITFSPDLTSFSSGSIRSTSANGHLAVTAPQAIGDTGNGASVTLSPATPAGAVNATIALAADLTTVTGPLAGTDFVYAAGNTSAGLAATVTLGAAGGGDIAIVAVTVPTVAGHSYKITASWVGLLPGGVAVNKYTFHLKRGGAAGTTLMSQRLVADGTNTQQCGGTTVVTDTPGAGTTTYTFTANHDTGADSTTLQTPAVIMVEGFA